MDVVRVIAEPRRREMLRLIWDAEHSAGEIAGHFGVTFGAVSQHLGVLRNAGLVVVRRDGTRRFYRADREALRPFASMLEQMWAAQLDRLTALAEAAETAGSTGAASTARASEAVDQAIKPRKAGSARASRRQSDRRGRNDRQPG